MVAGTVLEQTSAVVLRKDNDPVGNPPQVLRVPDLCGKALPGREIPGVQVPRIVNVLDEFCAGHHCRYHAPDMGIETMAVDDLDPVLHDVVPQPGDDSERRKAFDFVTSLGKFEQFYPEASELLLKFPAVRIAHMDFKTVPVKGTHEVEQVLLGPSQTQCFYEV
ncbi:MAG: hypothetical protein A4E57_01554 [Syntrophorhabdaceae bacterium PtaU1.Bin034]|nr:MAG: hypothetical protein A4E57_01554 [Syntrophorhabdaceae bacterium PtaU1.Bin034]